MCVEELGTVYSELRYCIAPTYSMLALDWLAFIN